MKKHLRSGFTLIELMIVISILGMVATVGVGNYIKAQQRGRDARRFSDLDQIQKAQEQYFSINSLYVNMQNPMTQPIPGILSLPPRDPVNQGTQVYTFAITNARNGYCVRVPLEQSQGNCVTCSCPALGNDCTVTVNTVTPANNVQYCVKNQQ